MIKINGKNYKLEEFEARWGKFTRTVDHVEKKGIAPRVFFFVGEGDDEKEIMVELSFTDEEFKNMKIGVEVNMKSEITDIGYTDREGWLSIWNNNFTSSLTKIEENKFHVKLKCVDPFEEIDIEIDEIITT